MSGDVELAPQCYYCGSEECFEGRFWTPLCSRYIEDCGRRDNKERGLRKPVSDNEKEASGE